MGCRRGETGSRITGVMCGAGLRYEGMKQPTHDQSEVQTVTLSIAGMSCEACARHIARALDGLTGVVHAEIDLARYEATVEHLPAFTDETAVIAAIRDAGYAARVTSTSDVVAIKSGLGVSVASCGCGCCGHRADP